MIYRCAKGDIDRREVEVNNTFQTPINLILGSSLLKMVSEISLKFTEISLKFSEMKNCGEFW